MTTYHVIEFGPSTSAGVSLNYRAGPFDDLAQAWEQALRSLANLPASAIAAGYSVRVEDDEGNHVRKETYK